MKQELTTTNYVTKHASVDTLRDIVTDSLPRWRWQLKQPKWNSGPLKGHYNRAHCHVLIQKPVPKTIITKEYLLITNLVVPPHKSNISFQPSAMLLVSNSCLTNSNIVVKQLWSMSPSFLQTIITKEYLLITNLVVPPHKSNISFQPSAMLLVSNSCLTNSNTVVKQLWSMSPSFLQTIITKEYLLITNLVVPPHKSNISFTTFGYVAREQFLSHQQQHSR
ncbi:unnamed protein product [Arctia plantaginis]|uniref:Uncharacterized protein n=1 Tax=Arctia plantaginis TaxID=874455 RepID=A0A8S1B2Q3_ARCPL|nr:unnamed protein product [Arctia plantaginis]